MNGDVTSSTVVQITDEESPSQGYSQELEQQQQQQHHEEQRKRACCRKTDHLIFKMTRDMLITLLIGYVIVDSFVVKLSSFNDDNDSPLIDYRQWIEDNSTMAVCLSILFYIINTILCTPIILLSISEIVLGFVFCRSMDFGYGLFYAPFSIFLGNSIGAITAFFIGRYVLTHWVERELTTKCPIMETLNLAILSSATNEQRHVSFKVLYLLRICPIKPYNEVNYIIGATMTIISFKWYLWSLFAMLPFILLLVIIGFYLGAFMEIGAVDEDSRVTIQNLIDFSFGSVAFIVAMLVLSYLAKKELDKMVKTWDENLDETLYYGDESDEEDYSQDDDL